MTEEQQLLEAKAALADEVFASEDWDSDEYGMRCHWCGEDVEYRGLDPWVRHRDSCYKVRYDTLTPVR